MKKYLLLTFVPLFFGCAGHKALEEVPAVEEIDNCACAYEPEPCREVKHPRILEEVTKEISKRPCENNQVFDCGCGNCDAFHPKHPGDEAVLETTENVISQKMTYIPAQKEAYVLLSNRIFNRFMKGTEEIYAGQDKVKIYMAKPVLKAEDLPQGFEEGVKAFENSLERSDVYQLTENEDDADYVISTTIDWFDTPSKDVPAIQYVVDLFKKDKTAAGRWSEIVKKADNKSWL